MKRLRKYPKMSVFDCFCKLGVRFVGVFVRRALLFGVYMRAHDFWKLLLRASILGIVIMVLSRCLVFGYLDPEGKLLWEPGHEHLGATGIRA